MDGGISIKRPKYAGYKYVTGQISNIVMSLDQLPVIVPLRCEECGLLTLRIGQMNGPERGISKVPYFSFPANCPKCGAMMARDDKALAQLKL